MSGRMGQVIELGGGGVGVVDAQSWFLYRNKSSKHVR